MASDSVVCETKRPYDVFLNFRGKDTRHTFTCHLRDALRRKGINTFMDDDKLKIGDQLDSKLLKAIEESKISVVVLSEKYATSKWCLDELVKIHECMNSTNHLVWPIFYKVDPSHVRRQEGSYAEAMRNHEKKFGKDSEEVKKWRSALTHIANLKGEHLKVEQGRDESKLIDDFVWKIFIKLSPKDLSKNEYIIGRETQVEKLKSLLDLESRHISCSLGIHGTGGIGKTTLAKALYDSIYKQFEASSFLLNVRETSNQIEGLKNLQKRLLSEILEDSKIKLSHKEEGIRTIKSRLGGKRILIVLDDVDDIEQLQNLVGEDGWLGRGSKVIITTRNIQLLDQGGVQKRYEVKVLNDQESLELFCQSAFRKSCPESNYEELSNRAVRYCKGLPLALKVLGSHMVGKDLVGWKDALCRYEKNQHPEVQRALRISYDSLSFNEKNTFLDIACFFKGEELKYVKRVLDACDFNSRDGITSLVNKSLLTVEHKYNDKGLYLEMHDLIQNMGREIVKEEALNEVGEHSRLWHHDDFLQLLANDDNGSAKIQGIMLDPPEDKEIVCAGTVFKNMKNLRILIVRNTWFKFLQEPCYLPNNLRLLEWENYPVMSFPSVCNPRKIGIINLTYPRLGPLPQIFEPLTSVKISDVNRVSTFPDVSGAMNLRELILNGCEQLSSFHESVGRLANLVSLSASYCDNLKSFVPIYLPSLEYLSFESCRSFAHFPEIKGKMDKLLKINLSETAIKELPESIDKLIGLTDLDMSSCRYLQHLPSSLFMLPNLVTLYIGARGELVDGGGLRESFRRFERSHLADSSRLERLHCGCVDLFDKDVDKILYDFPNLRHLDVSFNYELVSLPARIEECTKLTSLNVEGCKNLQEIPELPSSVHKVLAKRCDSLTSKTSNRLWSKMHKGIKRLQVIMPIKMEIPEWSLDYVNKEGGFPVFKARGKFPAVAVAFVFGREGVHQRPYHLNDVYLQLIIDGERRQHRHRVVVDKEHVLLCDLRLLLSSKESEDVTVGFGNNDWKTIQVCCETAFTLSEWGTYVYKHETNMEDIQFTSLDAISAGKSQEAGPSNQQTCKIEVAEPQEPVDKGKKKMVDQSKTAPKPNGENLMSLATSGCPREFLSLSITPPTSYLGEIPVLKVGEESRSTAQKDLEVTSQAIHVPADASKVNSPMLKRRRLTHLCESQPYEDIAMQEDPKNDEFDFEVFDILRQWDLPAPRASESTINKRDERAECETCRTAFREKAFTVDILTTASDENLRVEVREAAAKLRSFGGLVPEKEEICIQKFLDLLDDTVSKISLQKDQQTRIDNIDNTSLDQRNQIEFARQKANTSKLSLEETKSELMKLDASENVLDEKIAALQLELNSVKSEKQTLEIRLRNLQQTIKSSVAHAKSMAEQLKPQLKEKQQLETSQVELAEALESLEEKKKTQGDDYIKIFSNS